MGALRWPVTLLLSSMLGSATPSPVSPYTPAPPFPSQISPPSPTPSPGIPPPSPSFKPVVIGDPIDYTGQFNCPLRISPSTLVVRFGDSFTANCTVQRMAFSLLGWEVKLAAPNHTMDRFLVWSVDKMTEWDIKSTCYALSDQGGQCQVNLPVIVYKPPDNVSIGFVNHTGEMFEAHQYTLQCAVWDVAPLENVTVTFYKGQIALGSLQSTQHRNDKKPGTEMFTLNITTSKEDDGIQYWCEAKLDLGADGPLQPPVVSSQKLTVTVLYAPQLECPAKLQVREGETLSCEVKGNPKPVVTWYRDGRVVPLPARSSRKHAGKYTVLARGLYEQKNFTVEVEVLVGSGTANSCIRYFLLGVLLLQINWL